MTENELRNIVEFRVVVIKSRSRDKSRRTLSETRFGCHPEMSGIFFAAEARDQRGAICLESIRMNRFALISFADSGRRLASLADARSVEMTLYASPCSISLS
jgi:hypothetical protein